MAADRPISDHPPLLPRAMLVAGAVALLLVLLYEAGWAVVRIGAMVSQVLIPILVGVLLAALLMPIQLVLNYRLRVPRLAAAAINVLGLVGLISGTFYFAGQSIANGIDGLRQSVDDLLEQTEKWLSEGPLGIDRDQLGTIFGQAQDWLQDNTSMLSSGALNVTSSAGNVLVGVLLALIVCLFLLAEGDRILSWMLLLVRNPARTRIRETIRRSWVTIGSWARTQVVVSAVDALGIGIGAWALGLPFVVPMMIITFLLCFIPLFGAFLSGAMFTLVALLFAGPVGAIIMLAVVIAVQQLESNFLQPLLMGRAVNLHPLVVLLGVTTGTFLLGLTGALMTVPILAAFNSGYLYWSGRDPFPGLSSGGSALFGSPRTLSPSKRPSKLPKRVGKVTPEWLEEDRRIVESSTPVVNLVDDESPVS